MKFFSQTIAFLAFFGVFFVFSACSDNSSSPSGAPNPFEELSDKEKEQHTSVNSNGDTIIVLNETVYDKEGNEITYYSEGVFCWTEECEKKYASSSSKAPTSSASSTKPNSSSAKAPAVTISSSSAVPPSVDLASGTMVDNRDKTPYSIEVIGKLIWMSENLKYKLSTNYYCPTYSVEETTHKACDDFGGFYTYSEANTSCPSGWRLPTTAEVLAVDKLVKHEWWTIGGRYTFEGKSYDYNGIQGWYWAKSDGSAKPKNAWQVKNYENDQEHNFEDGKLTLRAYNVRCVTENK